MINWSHISLQDLAGYISSELKKRGIDTILVGGACVTIYSKNRYQSSDLDYISYEETKTIKKALAELGFFEKQKYFKHAECPWFIEFVTPPVAIGNESIKHFNEIQTSYGTIKLLRPEDSVKDRLAAFYHWKDKQGLEQAINICLEQQINIKEIEKWSRSEKQIDQFNLFKKELRNKLKTNPSLNNR